MFGLYGAPSANGGKINNFYVKGEIASKLLQPIKIGTLMPLLDPPSDDKFKTEIIVYYDEKGRPIKALIPPTSSRIHSMDAVISSLRERGYV